jgi:hypothetical protein
MYLCIHSAQICSPLMSVRPQKMHEAMTTTRLQTQDETYSDEEAARRRDELAKRILRMPPQPRKPSPSKLARAAAKPAKKKGGLSRP